MQLLPLIQLIDESMRHMQESFKTILIKKIFSIITFNQIKKNVLHNKGILNKSVILCLTKIEFPFSEDALSQVLLKLVRGSGEESL